MKIQKPTIEYIYFLSNAANILAMKNYLFKQFSCVF